MRMKSCALLIAIFFQSCQLSTAAEGDQREKLREIFGPPVESIPADTTRQHFLLNGNEYVIPRNYIRSVEKMGLGEVGAISMVAMLPDLAGVTAAAKTCFADFRKACNEEVVTIGIDIGLTTATSVRIRNIRSFIDPDIKKGNCGFHYFSDLAPTERTGQGFNYYVESDLFLRCPKDNTTAIRHCNSYENIGDGNSLYYVFRYSKLCQWQQIHQKVLDLIASFKKGG
jgi:hypothetical protein